jgi:hypothetical protein
MRSNREIGNGDKSTGEIQKRKLILNPLPVKGKTEMGEETAFL